MKRAVMFEREDTCNVILSALSEAEAERLRPHLRPCDLRQGEELGHAGKVPDEVIFPESGLLSLILDSAQRVAVEVSSVGREGVWDAMGALNGTPCLGRGMVQVSGWGWSLPAQVLRDEFTHNGALQKQVLRYIELQYAQAAVAAMCNRLHTIEERLSRWLLIIRGGAQSDELYLQNEFLASMLGSRLSSVPLALGVLQQAGLIELDGRVIRLLDVDALRRTSCECHHILAGRLQEYRDGSIPKPALCGA